MMAAATYQGHLIDRLPAVQGKLEAEVPLGRYTWFGVGGPAEALFRPQDEADLIAFLRQRPVDVPVTVIGVGSNMLVRDGGIEGVVIRLGRGFAGVRIAGERVHVGAGASDVNVAIACRNAGISGLEFLRGVPGTIGGALRMNAGAYGSEMSDVLVAAKAVNLSGTMFELSVDDFQYSYRHSALPEDLIFLSAELRGRTGEKAEIAERMSDIGTARAESQPTKARTGGSTFKNPPKAKAWELIDAAGCRGLKIGDAMVSEQHCNFLINVGDATASDIEALGEEVRRRVEAQSGIVLEWEIRRIGRRSTTVTGGGS